MKVIFDPQIFSLQKFGGISRYFSNLVQGMSKLGMANVRIHCPLYSSQHLKDVPNDLFHRGSDISNQHFWNFRRYSSCISNLISFKALITRNQFDIAHHTYYWYLPDQLPVRARVTTIHDMIDEEMNGITFKSKLKLRSIRQADHVICVSEFTRNALLRFYDVAPEKVTVVHLGKPEISLGHPMRGPEGRPSILYVGPRSGYKNFKRLLEAYASSKRLKRDFRIVCFGGGEFNAAEKLMFIKYGIKVDNISHFFGNDIALNFAYQSSALFVYPSLYEGFGLPPLEAMAQGAPIACANRASIPEIVGNAGEYFDPTDINSMRVAMESVLYSDTRTKELIRAGYEQAKNFSWDKCVRQTHKIYNSII